MMNITLQSILAKQNELNDMIAQFQNQTTSILSVGGIDITLNQGERYAGAIMNDDGTIHHHVILLPGDNYGDTNSNQAEWAKSIGGELPTRREQSLLIANLKNEFKTEWYWSSEILDDKPGYAWCQSFLHGFQHWHDSRSGTLRARAVRRLVV